MTYYSDYPNEPIGRGNPYYRCSLCGISDPQINGKIENHRPECLYRQAKEAMLSSNFGAMEAVLEDLESYSESDRNYYPARQLLHKVWDCLEGLLESTNP